MCLRGSCLAHFVANRKFFHIFSSQEVLMAKAKKKSGGGKKTAVDLMAPSKPKKVKVKKVGKK